MQLPVALQVKQFVEISYPSLPYPHVGDTLDNRNKTANNPIVNSHDWSERAFNRIQRQITGGVGPFPTLRPAFLRIVYGLFWVPVGAFKENAYDAHGLFPWKPRILAWRLRPVRLSLTHVS